MVRLSAKIEIEPSSAATLSARKVPTIARPPISSGRQGCDEAAEEEQREQEEQGEGEQLGHLQVLLDLLVHLLVGEREAADRNALLFGQLLADAVSGLLLVLVVGRGEADREVGRVAVAGDEVGGAGLGEADHAFGRPRRRGPALGDLCTRASPAGSAAFTPSISTITLAVAEARVVEALLARSTVSVSGSSAP